MPDTVWGWAWREREGREGGREGRGGKEGAREGDRDIFGDGGCAAMQLRTQDTRGAMVDTLL